MRLVIFLRKMRDSVIFPPPCSILAKMNQAREHVASGKSLATLASVVGLALVWSIVWANLPSWDELQSSQPRVPAVPAVPELDLTIPGVPSHPSHAPSRLDGEGKGRAGAAVSKISGEFSGAQTNHVDQVVEMNCAVEVQEVCPDTLTQEERHLCLERRMRTFSAPCQTLAKKWLVSWKAAEGYKVACAEEVKRVCRGADAEDGNLLACLKTREQDLSLGCYQSLPKGQIQLRD